MAVARRDHVRKAIAGGFFQANHGEEAPLKRLTRGDGVVFYSPRELMGSGAPVQAFTAIGEVVDVAPHHARQSETFQPFRRNVRYAEVRDT